MNDAALERVWFFPFRVLLLLLGMVWRVIDVLVLTTRPSLLRAYVALVRVSWRSSPYVWPRAYRDVASVKASGQQMKELVYGEAPLFVGVWILWRAGVGEGKTVLDIGAGRGRVLLAARRLGAEARGIEIVADHVLASARLLTAVGARLDVGDGLEVPLDDVDVVVVNWTGFREGTRERLVERFAGLDSGRKVVAVTHPIDHEAFEETYRSFAPFTWGFERVRIYTRK